MSDTLTKEQETLVDAYGLTMLKNGVKAGVKTDMKKVTKHVEVLYKKYLEIEPPAKTVLVASPEEAIGIVAKSTKKNPRDLVSEILYVNLWTWWVAYYHAGVNILGEKSGETGLDEALNEYEAMTHDIHALLPCEKVCLVIDYPKSIHIKDGDLDKFILHRENGLAFEYKDGTGFAWLNGVEVPDWLAKTPPKKLSTKKVMAETNTDVRREGLKRIGIERALKDLKAKVLDKVRGKKKWEHYDLLECDFQDGKLRRFLKMKNPSTGEIVVEQVTSTCKTVQEAHAMRNREDTYIEPEVIT